MLPKSAPISRTNYASSFSDDMQLADDTEAHPTVTTSWRSHGGNAPILPQTIQCPQCPSKFTRMTHLNRHLKTHSDKKEHECPDCHVQFTRSDILTRHMRTCGTKTSRPRSRKKACEACVEMKVKCDRREPCSRCITRDKKCVYSNPLRHQPSASSRKVTSPAARGNTRVPGGGDIHATRPSTTMEQMPEVFAPQEYPEEGSQPVEFVHDSEPHVAEFTPSPLTDSSGGSSAARQVESYDELWRFSDNANRELVTTPFTRIPTPRLYQLEPTAGGPIQSVASTIPSPDSLEPTSEELQHYYSLFFSRVTDQLPMIHVPTWTREGKPAILIRSMQAIGAQFAKTDRANHFVLEAFKSATAAAVTRFALSISADERQWLLVAMVMLHSFGLFHRDKTIRNLAFENHNIIVEITKKPPFDGTGYPKMPSTQDDYATIEKCWRGWGHFETMKRAAAWVYMHDCCLPFFFNKRNTFPCSQLKNMPCDTELWEAPNALFWLEALLKPNGYGIPPQRFLGTCMHIAFSAIRGAPLPPTIGKLTPMCYFILIHYILADLYTWVQDWGIPSPHSKDLLGRWLQGWLRTSSDPDHPAGFAHDPLPFFVFGHITLIAHENGELLKDADSDSRFWTTLHWLRHVRVFLDNNSQVTPELWENLLGQGAVKPSSEDQGLVDSALVAFLSLKLHPN